MTAFVVVMVEEPSCRIVVEHLCANMGIGDLVAVLQHDGKQDLEKSIARKVRGWRGLVPAYFIISRDLDAADREGLKERLLGLVPADATQRVKVRIVIPELETWYFGDPTALFEAQVTTKAAVEKMLRNAKLRDLCSLVGAKQEFKKLVGTAGQMDLAHRIGPRLMPERNRSRNFQAFVEALRWASSRARQSLADLAGVAEVARDI